MRDDNWFLNQKHLHYIKRADFERDLNTRNISKKSIVFIDEGRLIWTHGKFYQCEAGSWDQITGLLSNLYFQETKNEDGTTTYTLKGKDIGGNDFSTDASFTLLKNIFIESAILTEDGKTLEVTMSNGDIVTIDLTKLLQIQDFVNSRSIEFITSPDPEDPDKNILVSAYARELHSKTNQNVKVKAGDTSVTITTNNSSITLDDSFTIDSQNFKLGDNLEVTTPGTVLIQGQNGKLSIDDDTSLISTSGEVNIASGEGVNIQGSTVNINSTDGDVIIGSSNENSVKIISPLYLSEEYPDVEQTLRDLKNQIVTGLSAGNGLIIEDSIVSIDENQYFETKQQYWDN